MSFNANARPSGNGGFWSPENLASRAEQAQQRAAAEQQAQHQDFLSAVGPAMVGIINGYMAQNRRAETAQVEQDFRQAFPNAGPGDFRQTVDTLTREGVLYEMLGTPGLMGQRTTSLFVLSNPWG
ncbi:hypothetical protein [Streptosporangium pseudovulgare]|uniref:Uncharacterized protein n=1 Tax=Streptosporangium pseudovulgare TaxID=35765 RepID=A0ABQ2R6D9_9ACTN|nr:hypothetical protein [Streptosporangium pseudovulgare]GGQ11303.1 hypothetical protein GCM10010140_46820 [Streptosporangium pseudovulgare]